MQNWSQECKFQSFFIHIKKDVLQVYALEYLYKSFETNNANKSPKDHDQIHNIF